MHEIYHTRANVFATETRLRLSINWGRKIGKKI